MSEFLIREIVKADIQGMVKIWNQHYKALSTLKIKHKVETLTEWWEKSPGKNLKYFGLFLENRMKAFMMLEYRTEALWLKKMAVIRKDRKKGYGNELLKVVEKEAGNRKIYCEINQYLGDETSVLFYNEGFKQVDIFKDINGNDRVLKAIF